MPRRGLCEGGFLADLKNRRIEDNPMVLALLMKQEVGNV
jgi:hypothetical protein